MFSPEFARLLSDVIRAALAYIINASATGGYDTGATYCRSLVGISPLASL